MISIFLNARLMEIIPLKRQLIFGFVLMVLAVAGLMLGKSLTMFSLCMFILGVVSGITMSIGTFLMRTCMPAASAVHACCSPTPSSAWLG